MFSAQKFWCFKNETNDDDEDETNDDDDDNVRR